jgi:hypothetical protein
MPRVLVAGAVSAALLTPLVVFGGVGFAKSSPSAAQYQYGKTTLCHRTHSKKHPRVTITVGNAAVPAHLRHGDTLGPCPTTGTSSPGHTKGNGHESGKGHENGDDNGNGHDKGNGHHKGHGKP